MTRFEKNDYIAKYRHGYSYSLIPNWANTKKPAFKEKGEYEQYFDMICSEEIKPDYNVGVMLGKPSMNLIAFDDDTYQETFLDMFPEFRETTFTTKSGQKGGAIFFRLMELPKFNYATIKKDGKQIECFTRNRQIILPPSIHPDTGNQYEIKNDHRPLNITREKFMEIFEKFKAEGWEVSFSNDKKLFSLGIQNKDAVVHQGENRSLFLLRQIDSWKIKNPEFTEKMLYDLATEWNRNHCDPPYPDEKIRALVKQGYEFGIEKIIENSQQEALDESKRIKRESKETPIQQIERYLNTQVKNDPKLVSQLLRVCLSTYTNDPINIALLAPSSDGKTYATVKVTDIFPKEDVISVGRMSPTALIHQHGILIDKNGNSIQERIDEIDKKIIDSEKKDRKELERQKKTLLSRVRNCVDLKNKILLFLDNPPPATYEMLKPIMSHDKKEINYKTTKGDGSLSVKETVIRNWPVFIFCSAKNEDKNDVWEEIQTRVLMTSPNSTIAKYKEANQFTAQKMGLPSWGSAVYCNADDAKWAKWYIQEFRGKLNELCDKGNPVLNLLYSRLADAFPHSQGDYMRHFARLCSFVDLETMLNSDRRPVYELNVDGVTNTAIITTIDDIDQAGKNLGQISSLSPEKIKFYNEVFCPLVARKEQNIVTTLNGVWLTSNDLAEEYTRVLNKTTTAKKILENYLEPLADAGVLEVDKNQSKKNQNQYHKSGTVSVHNLSDLKSKIIEESKSWQSGAVLCLENLVKSSTQNRKSYEKITYQNQTITLEQLLDVISGNSSKSLED